MRQNAKIVRAPTDDENVEVFYATYAEYRRWPDEMLRIINALRVANFLLMTPLGEGFYLFNTETANGPTPTITPTHIRLPKLSHLITLVPSDFFLLLRLLATAKNTQTGDSLSLNFGAAGIQNLAFSAIDQFFIKLRVNYRMNPDYCDRKWTPRDAIKFLANLEPTRENQLSAMQYLTVLQNEDLLYFPLDAMIDLELDWEQVSDDYCTPPESLHQ